MHFQIICKSEIGIGTLRKIAMNIILLDKDRKRLIHSLMINDEMLFCISGDCVLKVNTNDRSLSSGIVQKIQNCASVVIK